MDDIWKVCDFVRETAYDIHIYLAHGHLERIYENALTHRLRLAGVEVEQQYPLEVRDEDGTLLGQYFADLLVSRALIVEVKSAKAIAREHEAQLLGYLRSARIEHGLLINFGSYRFQVRKFILSAQDPTDQFTAS